MASVDILIPSGRPLGDDFQLSLSALVAATQCRCGGHLQWECPNGKHSVMHEKSGSAIIHWLRNTLISKFMYERRHPQRPFAEWAFLTDDDMAYSTNTLVRLISHNLPVVGGIATRRRDPPIPVISRWSEEDQRFYEIVEWEWDSQRLIRVDATGAACLLVHRSVFERMADAYLDCEFERMRETALLTRLGVGKDSQVFKALDEDLKDRSETRKNHHARALREGRSADATCWWFEFWKHPTNASLGEMGEDITFATKLRLLGIPVFVDPQVKPAHIGPYGYTVDDYKELRELQQKANVLREEELTLPAR